MSEYVMSKRGKEHITNDGYIYRCRYIKNKVEYFTCVVQNCKGKFRQNENGIKVFSAEHDHPPDSEHIAYRKCVEEMKNRAKTETTPIPKIFTEEVTKYMDAGFHLLSVPPTYDNVRTSLYRERHKGMI